MAISGAKQNYCGCNACLQICPRSCIRMDLDNEGFWYPEVDLSECINCGLCEKVCPELVEKESIEPLSTYASYYTSEEIRIKSSSGGIFYLLAEKIIEQGGVVFGARFDENWNVMHSYTDLI